MQKLKEQILVYNNYDKRRIHWSIPCVTKTKFISKYIKSKKKKKSLKRRRGWNNLQRLKIKKKKPDPLITIPYLLH